MTITTNTVFTTADGKTFATRAEAVVHQDFADRCGRVEELLAVRQITGNVSVEQIAELGMFLVAALTLPSKMGPKPKAPAAPVAAE